MANFILLTKKNMRRSDLVLGLVCLILATPISHATPMNNSCLPIIFFFTPIRYLGLITAWKMSLNAWLISIFIVLVNPMLCISLICSCWSGAFDLNGYDQAKVGLIWVDSWYKVAAWKGPLLLSACDNFSNIEALWLAPYCHTFWFRSLRSGGDWSWWIIYELKPTLVLTRLTESCVLFSWTSYLYVNLGCFVFFLKVPSPCCQIMVFNVVSIWILW